MNYYSNILKDIDVEWAIRKNKNIEAPVLKRKMKLSTIVPFFILKLVTIIKVKKYKYLIIKKKIEKNIYLPNITKKYIEII